MLDLVPILKWVFFLFFSCIFQTICAYLPLAAGRPQWKRATNPKILRISEGFGVYGLKNQLCEYLIWTLMSGEPQSMKKWLKTTKKCFNQHSGVHNTQKLVKIKQQMTCSVYGALDLNDICFGFHDVSIL